MNCQTLLILIVAIARNCLNHILVQERVKNGFGFMYRGKQIFSLFSFWTVKCQ
uniref:Uncharacterized protein n=1 Tax=Populus trichocarpa TaxID=3694 RepID=A9P9L7_POPTR|nr:unknown [Populus trichocarpa]